MPQRTVDQLAFDFLPQLPVVVQRHEGQITSDAGLLPLLQFDRRWNYTARMAGCLVDASIPDPRQSGRKPFTTQQRAMMLRQRLFGILAGYEDCNDHDDLRADPVFKMAAGRMPEDEALFSQPSLSRFENSISIDALHALLDFLILTGIEQLKQKHGGQLPESITLDLDPTDDPTHGQQQLSLFHGYFKQYQYFPMIISEPTTKHVFSAWLRPGTMHASLGADDDLMRVVNALRKQRPAIRIHVRGDAGFGNPAMYEVCEKNGLTYTFGFSSNSRLKELTQAKVDEAQKQFDQTKEKQRLFQTMQYQAESWDRSRTIVAKAECHKNGPNLRFVITNLPDVTSDEHGQKVYDGYIERGESEQRMDELKNGLKMDRLSCHRFASGGRSPDRANFFRLLLHAAAFNLLNAMRQDPQLPEFLQKAQPQTWRMSVIKVAATIVQTARRIIVKLAGQWPNWTLYHEAGKRALAFQFTS